MRRVVLALVLANVLFFAWHRGWFAGYGGDPAPRSAIEQNAERLRPVPSSRLEPDGAVSTSKPVPNEGVSRRSPEGAPAAPDSTAADATARAAPPDASAGSDARAPTSPSAAPAAPLAPAAPQPAEPSPISASRPPTLSAVCRSFAALDEERAQALRGALEASGARIEAQRIEQGSSYLVYLPPALTPAAAQQRLVELQRIGRDDAFVIQDGPLRLAVSLALFRFETAARTMVEQLQRAGETRARILARPPFQVRVRLRAEWSQGDAAGIASMLGAQFDVPVRDCE